MDDEPIRLRDDPSVDPALREDLARVAEVAPVIDASAGLARLRESIGGGGAGGIGGAGSWIAGTALVLALAGAGWWAASSASPQRPRETAPEPVASEPVAPARAEIDRAPIERATAIEPTITNTHDEPARSERARTRRAPPASPAPARADEPAERESSGDPLREEMALLARARAALGSDPARALALAEEGNRRFPAGLFGEEREAIAVLALRARGETDEARRRGQRFLRAHPTGTFSERVRRAIEHP